MIMQWMSFWLQGDSELMSKYIFSAALKSHSYERLYLHFYLIRQFSSFSLDVQHLFRNFVSSYFQFRWLKISSERICKILIVHLT